MSTTSTVTSAAATGTITKRRGARAARKASARSAVPVGAPPAPVRSAPPSAAAPARSVPAPAPAPVPAASPAVRSPRPATQPALVTFSAPRVPVITGLGVALCLLAAFMAFWAVSGAVDLVSGGSVVHIVTNVVFVAVCLVIAAGMALQGRALLTMRVELSPTELVAHGRTVRVQRAKLSEIYSLRRGHRPMSTLLGEHRTVEVPYVQLQDGSGFWLDALGGWSSERPPTEAQHAMFDQVSVLVQRARSVPTAR